MGDNAPRRGLRRVQCPPPRVPSLREMWSVALLRAQCRLRLLTPHISLDRLSTHCTSISSLQGLPDDLIMTLLVRILRKGKMTVPIARLFAASGSEEARAYVALSLAPALDMVAAASRLTTQPRPILQMGSFVQSLDFLAVGEKL